MQINCVKLDKDARLPKKAHEEDAGFDLWPVAMSYTDNKCLSYRFGLAVHVPEGHVGLLFPRSSVHKLDVSLANSVGVIDHGYTGEVKAIFRHTGGSYGSKIPRFDGKAVAQLVIVPIAEVSEMTWTTDVPESSRQDGGFGSSDKQTT